MSNILSDGQIAYLANRAGFKGQDLVTAIAVAIAESSGDANNANSTTSTGLWQVQYSSHKNLVPNQTALFDPITNAKAAFSVFQGSGWGAWTTYNTGAYKQYIPRAEQAVANQNPPSFKQLTASKANTGLGGQLSSIYSEATDWGITVSGSGVGFTTQGPGGVSAGVYTGSHPTKTGNLSITNPLDALGVLTARGTWIRVAEIVAGIVALLMGLYLAAKGLK